jgi:osmotically-inducible protein OsmY
MAELKGSVDAFWKKKKVEEIVKDTAGVVDVRNELTVVPTHDITDEVVGRNIMEAIDRNYRLDAESINIKVKDGKVILAGQVPDWRAKVALYDIALHTGGVIDVQDEMEVKGEGE